MNAVNALQDKTAGNRLRNLFLLLILVLLLAVVARLEWQENRQVLGFRQEVLRNPYFVLQRFLAERGHGVDVQLRAINLPPLPPVDGLVIFRGSREHMEGTQLDQLFGWVEAGGTLLVEAALPQADDAAPDAGDPLLQRAGIWPVRRDLSGLQVRQDSNRPADSNACAVPASLCEGTEIPIAGQPYQACVTLGKDMHRLVWQPGLTLLVRAGEDLDVQLASRALGKGQVIVATDLGFLQNGQLANRDNAYFIAVLAAGHKTVQVLVRPGKPGFLAYAFSLYPWTISLLVIVLVSAVWHAAPRRGPLWVGTPSVWHSQYRDHLRNAGGFLWRHGGCRALLDELQQDVLNRLARHRRQLQLPADADMLPHLARLAGLSAETVRRAFVPLPQHNDADALIERIHTLQILRKTL